MTFAHPPVYPCYPQADLDAWKHLDWTVEADGYRLVIEDGAIIGLKPVPQFEVTPAWALPMWGAATDDQRPDLVLCRRCAKAEDVYTPPDARSPARALAYGDSFLAPEIKPVPFPDLSGAILAADAAEWHRATGWEPYDCAMMALVMRGVPR